MKHYLTLLVALVSSSMATTMFAQTAKTEAPKIGAEIRMLYNNLSGDSYLNPVSSFDLRNIRPYFKGSLLDGHFKYQLVLTYDKNSTDIGVLDLVGDYQVSEALGIRFGQFKVPFDRQFMTATTATQFAELAVGDLKPLSRDRGVDVHGNLFNAKLTYNVGLYNGAGIEKKYVAKNKDGKDDQQHVYAARVTLNPQGEYGYKLALPGQTQAFKSTLGFGVATGQKNATTDLMSYCFDVASHFKGFSGLVEYQHLELKTSVKETTTGLTAQGGYFITAKLEPAVCYATKKIKNGVTTTELTTGVNYYLAENNAKIQLNYTRLVNKLSASEKMEDNLVLCLFQFIF